MAICARHGRGRCRRSRSCCNGGCGGCGDCGCCRGHWHAPSGRRDARRDPERPRLLRLQVAVSPNRSAKELTLHVLVAECGTHLYRVCAVLC